MNELQWRRQLRDLRQPLTPPANLWASIDAALSGEHEPLASDQSSRSPRRTTHPRWLLAALAASLMLVGGIAWRTLHAPSIAPAAVVLVTPTSWKPADPRLAGAAIELDAAQMELKLALEQAPDSPALQRLLDRTKMQQSQLRQWAHQAG